VAERSSYRSATDPSPGPRRLVKAPSRATLSPRERDWSFCITAASIIEGVSSAGWKVRSQLIIGGEEVFGLDAGLPDDRHETGVSRPAGEYVQVKVIRHAGACTSSQIHTQIKPFGVIAIC